MCGGLGGGDGGGGNGDGEAAVAGTLLSSLAFSLESLLRFSSMDALTPRLQVSDTKKSVGRPKHSHVQRIRDSRGRPQRLVVWFVRSGGNTPIEPSRLCPKRRTPERVVTWLLCW